MSEPIDPFNGFFHQALRFDNLFLKALRVGLRRLLEREEPHMDAEEGLGDLIVKTAAALLPFVLPRPENGARELPQLLLQAMGLGQ